MVCEYASTGTLTLRERKVRVERIILRSVLLKSSNQELGKWEVQILFPILELIPAGAKKENKSSSLYEVHPYSRVQVVQPVI